MEECIDQEECIDPAVAGKNIRLVYEPDNRNWRYSVAIPNGISQEYLRCVRCPVSSLSAVAEAVGLLAGLKTPAEEYLGAVGQWPSIEELGGRNSGTYTANIVSGEFFFQATLKTVEEECIDPAVAGKNIRLVYEPDNQNWTCSSVTIPNGIPQEYLPNGCH